MRTSLRHCPRGPEQRRCPDRLPENRSLPLAYRLDREESAEPPQEGELTRDGRLAWVEAALLAADEPLTPRKLAAAAGLVDGTGRGGW
jgi:hypothetical protein